jgi:hypothetical protein
MTITIEAAREMIAGVYPEYLTDTMGRQHVCIPRQAILRGDWDAAAVVQDALSRLLADLERVPGVGEGANG